jgi:hypothetical protein
MRSRSLSTRNAQTGGARQKSSCQKLRRSPCARARCSCGHCPSRAQAPQNTRPQPSLPQSPRRLQRPRSSSRRSRQGRSILRAFDALNRYSARRTPRDSSALSDPSTGGLEAVAGLPLRCRGRLPSQSAKSERRPWRYKSASLRAPVTARRRSNTRSSSSVRHKVVRLAFMFLPSKVWQESLDGNPFNAKRHRASVDNAKLQS